MSADMSALYDTPAEEVKPARDPVLLSDDTP
jgi:hypothetical protein